MHVYFEANLADIFLVYGLAFFILGVVIFVLPRQETALHFVRHLPLIAAFGLLHGTLEFLIMWKLVHQVSSLALDWVCALLLLASFLPLLEFGRRMLWGGTLAAFARRRRALVPVLYALLLLAILAAALLADDARTGLVLATRYLLGFPAALLAGLGLLVTCKRASKTRPGNRLGGYLRTAAAGFIAYALFTLVLANRPDGLPALFMTEYEFLHAFGVPVQLLRALCAVVVALAIVYLVRQINYENRLRELQQVLQTRLANDQLNQAQKISHLGSFEWNPASGELLWTPEHFRLWGLEPYSVIPDHALYLRGIHPDDAAKIEGALQQALQGGRFYDCEHRVVWPDGSVHHIHGRGEVIFADIGQPVLMRGTVQDISERKLIEGELWLAKFIVDNSKNAIFRLSPQGKVLYANDAACRALGYTREALLTLHVWDFDPNISADRWVSNWKAQQLTGVNNIETQHQRRDGSVFPVEVSANYIEHGGNEYSVAFAHDITARKLAEQALKTLNESLEHKVEDKIAELREKDHVLIEQARLASMGEMINNIAHQWRQPLSVIGLTFQNLALDFKDGTLDERSMQEYLDNAINVVNKMSTTIDDFRNFFRPNREKTIFNLHDAIAQAVALIEISLKHNNIALLVAGEGKATVRGYPNDLSQVLLNLLSNAKDVLLEHKIHPAVIDVLIRCERDNALVTVRDNGGGIPVGIIAKIFDPYFTTKESGTGIGLYMSKTIMDNMGGTIAARNTGTGAEFTLSLPLAAV